MSKSKKIFATIATILLIPIITKSAHSLYIRFFSSLSDVPDGMGYTSLKRAEAIASQTEKLQKSWQEFDEGCYDEILNRCRIQLEFFLTYILRCENHYDFPSHPPATLSVLISKCKKHSLLPHNIEKNLNNAKSYCNSGSHYSDNPPDFHSIFFVITVTEEVMDYWKSYYAEK